MSFDGQLLNAPLTQAVASIPVAIKKIRKLVSKGNVDNSSLSEEIDRLCEHIASLGEIKGWLDEVKRLHEHLHNLDETMLRIKRYYIHAIKAGKFNANQYNLEAVRKHWEEAKQGHLAPVLAFAREIKRIDRQPLQVDNDGKPVAGPDWVKRLLQLQDEIDYRFSLYEQGNDAAVNEIAELFNNFYGYVRTCRFLAEERVRNEAGELGNLLSSLGGTLKNV